MELLFDENLSPKLVVRLADVFPGSTHPDLLGMRGASDEALWQLARSRGLVLVSKDDDFRQRAFLRGPPPKVVWLAVGNCVTGDVERLLREQSVRLHAFAREPHTALLTLR